MCVSLAFFFFILFFLFLFFVFLPVYFLKREKEIMGLDAKGKWGSKRRGERGNCDQNTFYEKK